MISRPHVLFFALLLGFLVASPSMLHAVIPQPALIGGTVTVDGIQLTQDTDNGYVIKVTNQSGTPYKDYLGNPSQDADGLNGSKYYTVYIPLFDATDQPEGAHSGDTALISVYKDAQKLTVANPPQGTFSVPDVGSVKQIDLAVTTSPSWAISGTVTFGGVALGGVALNLTGSASQNTTTDSNGYYRFFALSNGLYTIVPSKTGYTFSPPSLSANVNGADVTGKNFTATVAVTHTITASAGANGSIFPSGLVQVIDGSDQTFTITPAVGYHVSDILVDGVSVGSRSRYTFKNVTVNHSIAATFSPRSLWYVNNDIAAPGDGSTWASAFKTVQQAVDAAKAGDEIWVKGSHYLLTAPVTVNKSLAVYGGFAGTEIQRDKRNWRTYPTIMDGQGNTQCFQAGDTSSDLTLDGFVITQCHGSLGGGISTSASVVRIANCVFEANSANSGGAVYESGATASFNNCSFWGNNATLGGAIFNEASAATMVNCTFSGNLASSGGGGIANDVAGSVNITNSILWGDKHGDAADEIDNISGTVTVTYSNVQGGYAGTGNLASDPKFLDAANGNLRLQTTSPCIDAGTGSAVSLAENDLGHNSRVVDGNLDGSAVVDMGAYEYQTAATVATLAAPSGTITTRTPTYVWDAVYNCTWYFLWVDDSTGNRIKQWYSAAQAGCSSGAGSCSVTPETVLEKGSAKWWLQTYNSKGPGPWSNGMAFTVAPVMPGKATLISPSGTSTTNIPTYTWNKVANTTWYWLYVDDSTGNRISTWFSSTQAGCSAGAETCSVTPSVGLVKGSATWWIRTWNSNGFGQWSEGLTFSVPDPIMPEKTTLLSPLNTTTATNWPGFTWNTASNASWYQLYVSDSTGNRINSWYSAAQSCSGGTCTASPGIALEKGSANWWVRAWNPNGYGLWSATGAFQVPSPVFPGKVTLISPSGSGGTGMPTYSWNADPPSTYYHLWVSDSTGNRINQWFTPTEAGCAGGTGTCSVTPGTQLAGGSATWWVQTWNPNGSGPWSNGMTFTVTLASGLNE